MSYLVYGQNALEIDERVAELRGQLDPQGLSTTVIDVQSSSTGEIAAALQAMPFFGGTRVVVLLNPLPKNTRSEATESTDEGAQDNEDGTGTSPTRTRANRRPVDVPPTPAELLTLLGRMPPSTHVIARHDGSLAATSTLVKSVKALGWTTHVCTIRRGHDLLAWLDARVQSRGAQIDPRAAETLLDRLFPIVWRRENRYDQTLPDMRLLATEVEKLVAATPDGRIDERLVRELVADRSGFEAFKLNDAIFSGNVTAALRELDAILETGEPAERVMAQLASEVAGLVSARHAAQLGPAAVAAAAGISEGRVKAMASRAAQLGPGAVRVASERMRAADRGVKSGEGAENASAAIVPLVGEIAEAARRGASGDRRQRG